MHSLADLGLSDAAALARSVKLTAAKIRNSPVLVEHQAHAGCCHSCGASLDGSRPEVAILNAGGSALHLHGGECHETHSRRRAELVDRIMVAAGYGAGPTEEAA